MTAAKVTALHVALIFVNHRVIPYGKQGYLLSDNGAQFVCKISFVGSCVLCSEETHPYSLPPAVKWTSQTF